MKRALIVACLLGTSLAALAQEGTAAVDARWVAAMKANDVAAVVACYAPDAVAWLPSAPEARGTEAIRKIYTALLGANTVLDVSVPNPTYVTNGDFSAGWGYVLLTLKPKSGGEAARVRARFVVVSKKIGGKWYYVADHASDEPPAQAAAPTPKR